MALFCCPACALPLTDAETLQVTCPACGSVLKPAGEVPPAVATESQRRFAWLPSGRMLSIGGVALALLILAAFVGRWTSGSRAAVGDTPLAKANPAPKAMAEPENPAKPSAEPKSERAPVSYPRRDSAVAKTPGEEPTDVDIGARNKPAGSPALADPQGKYVGDWTISYTHGAVRSYSIDKDGKVSGMANELQLNGKIELKDAMLLLTFDGEDKLERLTLGTNGNVMFIEHYHPKSDFPDGKAAHFGIGVRQ
jgi:hypothetical protein